LTTSDGIRAAIVAPFANLENHGARSHIWSRLHHSTERRRNRL